MIFEVYRVLYLFTISMACGKTPGMAIVSKEDILRFAVLGDAAVSMPNCA